MRRCGLCGYLAHDEEIFDKHMRRVHDWQDKVVDDRPRVWRNCATTLVILLGIFGVSTLALLIFPPRPDLREGWPFLVSVGAGLLAVAFAVWYRWVKRR